MASTKHLLLNMLEFRFAELRGICSFQISQINVTNLVSQLSCSSRFRYLGLAWLGLLGSAWVGMVSLGFKQDPQRITTGVKPGISHQRQKGPFVEPCHTTLTAHPHIDKDKDWRLGGKKRQLSPIGKSVSVSFRVRVVRACVRACVRSCAGA